MNRFVITDSTFYIGCHTREAICPETHRQYSLQSTPRLRVMLNEKESTLQLYHRCEDVPCTTICPVNAITRVDGAVQLNESLCVSCKLCGTTCPFGTTEFSDNRPLDIPANANTLKASPAPPASAHVNTLLDWVPGIRVITVRCDLCSFDEQGLACVWICPTKALHLMDNTGITRISKRECELTFSTGLGDLTLFQQAQSGETR